MWHCAPPWPRKDRSPLVLAWQLDTCKIEHKFTIEQTLNAVDLRLNYTQSRNRSIERTTHAGTAGQRRAGHPCSVLLSRAISSLRGICSWMCPSRQKKGWGWLFVRRSNSHNSRLHVRKVLTHPEEVVGETATPNCSATGRTPPPQCARLAVAIVAISPWLLPLVFGANAKWTRRRP